MVWPELIGRTVAFGAPLEQVHVLLDVGAPVGEYDVCPTTDDVVEIIDDLQRLG